MESGTLEVLFFQQKAEIDLSDSTVFCEGKGSRLPFPNSSSRSNDILNLVHAYMCWPIENRKSLGTFHGSFMITAGWIFQDHLPHAI